MFPLEVYKRLREEQRELAVRIGRLNQFIDNHDNMGTNKELDDDYMDLLRDQLESMQAYNGCLIQRIGFAVTEGIAPLERSRGNQAIRRDVNKFRESSKIDPRDPAKQNPAKQDSDRVVAYEAYGNFDFDPVPKQDSDKVVADEDEHNFGFYCGFDTSIL